MTRHALALLALVITSCAPSTGAHSSGLDHSVYGFLSAGAPHAYTLTKVSGDNQSGSAVLSVSNPFTRVSPNVFTRTPPTQHVLSLPLVVEVRDEQGRLADDVEVRFRPETDAQGFVGPEGLGTSVTGWKFRAASVSWPATPGQAATLATPYVLGPQHATCSVEPAWGTSNEVTFTVLGTP